MSVYIVETESIKQNITEKEPYKSFLCKFKNIEEELHLNKIVLDMTNNHRDSGDTSLVYSNYFKDLCMRFMYFKICSEEMSRYLICHEIEFEYDNDFFENIVDKMESLKDKASYIYLPDVEEIEINYNLEYEKCVLHFNVVASDKDKIKDISMHIMSLDVMLLAMAV